MRALRLIRPGYALEMMEIPAPTICSGEVLIRVKAAGICHSDAHYRAGRSAVHPLPLTLGHEVAGVVEQTANGADQFKPGDRVCIHYLATCGECRHCRAGFEQFCRSAAMMGKHRDGGYADFVAMPARSLMRLSHEIPFEAGAVMMCSSATALHALNKARLKAGESVAVYGLGGLGMSAVQLAKALGAVQVFGVDIKPAKLARAKTLGITPVDAGQGDPVEQIRQLTQGHGVDVALELIGLPLTMRQAVLSLGVQGRAALAGITEKSIELYPYQEILNKEAEVIGVSDHLARELPALIEFARQGKLDLSSAITRVIPLDAAEVNGVLDELERFGDAVRVVITP
ncbi:MAG TPA: zinc-binding dehydrogenase [Verrucomicrobiae bacterium]|nr:zinc-binding dehydrogenase [Verrucomicrobiae bacterium]